MHITMQFKIHKKSLTPQTVDPKNKNTCNIFSWPTQQESYG